jgi:hypothetical protein
MQPLLEQFPTQIISEKYLEKQRIFKRYQGFITQGAEHPPFCTNDIFVSLSVSFSARPDRRTWWRPAEMLATTRLPFASALKWG